MAKIILTQEFDSFEERAEFRIASQATDMSLALDAILQALRRYDKYGHNFKDADDAVDKIREEVYEIIRSHNVTLE